MSSPQRKYRPVVEGSALQTLTADWAMISSARSLLGQQLPARVRFPLSSMRNISGFLSNSLRGSSEPMACSSCSTWRPSARHLSKKRRPCFRLEQPDDRSRKGVRRDGRQSRPLGPLRPVGQQGVLGPQDDAAGAEERPTGLRGCRGQQAAGATTGEAPAAMQVEALRKSRRVDRSRSIDNLHGSSGESIPIVNDFAAAVSIFSGSWRGPGRKRDGDPAIAGRLGKRVY